MTSFEPKHNSRLPLYVRIAQVAESLAVSQPTVRRWIDRGELPFHKFGDQIRISTSDLESFVRARRQVRQHSPSTNEYS